MPSQAALRFHWVSDFSDVEQIKLEAWMQGTYSALEDVVGVLPFEVNVYMHRRDAADEPVPWANTRRGRGLGVSFHVDPTYSIDEFRGDWTAPHELSHLVLPYLGPASSWFAEGFASYMQYQVMQAMRVISGAEAAARYQSRLQRARREYNYADRPFAEAAPRLREKGRYPVMYWGGAAYFLQADAHLRKSGSSVVAVLRKYLACCRRDKDGIDSLVRELDRVAESDIFGSELTRFRKVPGFPAYEAAR